MRRIFKIVIIPLLILTSIFMSEISLCQSHHVYLNGKVINFSDTTIKIDTAKEVFYIVKTTKVLKHIKVGSSIYEEKASLKELKTGYSVTLKIKNNIVDEIIIEEYKR